MAKLNKVWEIKLSRIKLDTPGEVVSFLRILAEESVTSAREALASDPKQGSIEKQIKQDTEVYGSLEEADPPEEDEEQDKDDDESEGESEAKPNGIEVSLDSISDAIKQLRSGRSVDDSQIKTHLRTYFDRLSEPEREALLTFLNAFSGILTGSSTGQDAPDPSDPPWMIIMKRAEARKAKEQQPETPATTAGEEEEEEEGTTEKEPADQPPIKAGGQQSLQEIRDRVRELMNLR